MFGVPSNLDLSAFPGREVIGVQFGAHQVRVQLHPDGCLSWEGRYELETDGGSSAEAGTPDDALNESRLTHLVGSKIVLATSVPPGQVQFRFSNGHRLSLIDSSRDYESFELWPGPIVV